jgi:hypothetical protein
LPSGEFNRFFGVRPNDGRGELISREDVDRAVKRGKDIAAAMTPGRVGTRFLGIDVGVKRDHYALCLLCLTPGGAVYLEKMESFVPPAGGEVDLAAAETVVEHYCKVWGARALADPFQAKQMLQKLTADGCDVEAIDPSVVNLTAMTHAVMDLFRDNRLWMYEDAGFTKIGDASTCLAIQLLAAQVVKGDRGIRIANKRSAKLGHGDQVSAFSLAALGVARAGVFLEPVAVGSPEPDRVTAARERLDHRRGLLGAHAGIYTGPRAARIRKVAR